MATIGPVKVFSKSLASGVTALTFDVGGGYRSYMLQIPSMPSGGGDIRFAVSNDEGVTYKTLYHAPTVATAAPTVVNIASTVCNCVVGLPTLGQHFQVYLTTAATGTYAFSVICTA